jgi:nitrate reductase gamma subunit
MTNASNQLLFIVLPYLALLLFLVGTIMRYFKAPFTYSSLSSQFLENRQHFWGLVPFHYGIVVVLVGHVVAFLIPRHILAWNSQPLRLYVLEVAALTFALLALVGLFGAILRRATVSKLRVVTSPHDWAVLALLVVQIASGIYIAVFHPWGSSWFAAAAAPYLWSLLRFSPDISYVAMMPWGVKLHLVLGYALIGFTPFTRLVHFLVVPNPYLWRRPQVVRWYGAAPAGAEPRAEGV